MQRCRQMSDIAHNGVKYQSESSAGKEYTCYAFRLNEIDTCDCIAFVMARNKEAKKLGLKERGISAAGLASDCKHLQQIRRVTCQWTQQSENDYRYDETCPKCGGAVVEEGTPMIPGGVGHDADHVDDLKAMLAELRPAVEAEVAAEPEVDSMIEAAEDVIGTVEAPPVNRQHGTIPTDPAEWVEDLIASRNGEIPTGDDWKQLRELWGPVYGKRNIDRAYKAAQTPDAILARQMAAPTAAGRVVVDREAQDAATTEEFGYNPFRSADPTTVEGDDDPEAKRQADIEATKAARLAHLDSAIAQEGEKYRCLNCGREYPTEAEMQDCMYADRSSPVDQAATLTVGGTTITLTRSEGADGAVLVMIDTRYEPDASDGGSGLRVLVNDAPVYAGKDYEPADDDERDHAETLPGEPGYDTSYGDKIDQADAEATGPEAAANRLAAHIK